MAELTPATCRAARGLLDWTQRRLAEAAGVGLSTVKGFEGGTKAPMRNNLEAMRRAIEEAGVDLTNGEEPGVKMRKAHP